MRDLDIKPMEPKNHEYLDFLNLYALYYDPDAPHDPKLGDAMFSLWKDKSVNKLRGHQKEVDLADSTSEYAIQISIIHTVVNSILVCLMKPYGLPAQATYQRKLTGSDSSKPPPSLVQAFV